MTPFRKSALLTVNPAVHAGTSGAKGSATPNPPLLRYGVMKADPSRHSPKGVGGFSLIFMSIFITIMAMIIVAVLPDVRNDNARTIDDIDKLNTVEEHMRSFMAFNGRRPCPADGQYSDLGTGSKYFGKEAAIAGTCQGGTPAAPLGPNATPADCSGGGCIVAGTIPTRSIGLSDDYAFDSYGRRFTYVVDKRATSTATCINLEGITSTNFTPTGKGGLTISNAAATSSEQVMYAYIQHGPSGYGAWPGDGSATTLTAAQSAARRVNSGSTDLAMQMDAAVAPGADPGPSTFAPDLIATLVKNSLITPYTTGGKLDTGFSDLVWYRDDLKNTCCLGPKCVPKGFRIDNSSKIYGIGDINGDEIPDLVISGYSATWNNYIAVIFGTKNMGNSSSDPWPIPPTGLDPSTLNGTNGFIVDSWGQPGNVTVADINGDGYADLFYCTYPKCYVVFGGYGGGANGAYLPGGAAVFSGPCKGYTNVAGSNAGNNTSCATIDTSGIDNGGSWDSLGSWNSQSNATTAVGKIDNSGYKSLIALGACFAYNTPWSTTCSDSMSGFVLYGMPSGTPGSNTPGTWSGTSSLTVSSFNGTNGFEIHSSSSQTLGSGGDILGHSFDFDHDGYDDILIGAAGAGGAPITKYGAIYVIYGRPRAYWTASLTGTSPAFLDIAAELNTANDSSHCNSAITCATEFYNSSSAMDYNYNNPPFGADLKGGSSTPYDMVTTGLYGPPPTVVYGGTRYPATFDLNTLTSTQGFSVQLANCCNGLPSWYAAVSGVAVADVNSDGRNDLLLSTANGSAGYVIDGRSSPGAVAVFYQPSGGWPLSLNYNNFHWDGTDSFQIIGPFTSSNCGFRSSAYVGDVRPGDGGKPEIMVSCDGGEPGKTGGIYGLYKNKGWPSSIDLNKLN